MSICIFYILYRNDKVYLFQSNLIDMASKFAKKKINDDDDDWKHGYDIIDKYSYDEMLFSFKPLTLDALFTEDEIKILKGDEQ